MARAISWFTALSSTTSARPREPDCGRARMRVLCAVSTGAETEMRSSVHSGLTRQRFTPAGGVDVGVGRHERDDLHRARRRRGAQAADRLFHLRGGVRIDDDADAADARAEILQRLDGADRGVDADDVRALERNRVADGAANDRVQADDDGAEIRGRRDRGWVDARHAHGNAEREAAAAARLRLRGPWCRA